MIKELNNNSIIADLRFIFSDRLFIVASVTPVLLILLLKFVIPPLVVSLFQLTLFQLKSYYTVFAITLIFLNPLLFGIAYALKLSGDNAANAVQLILLAPSGRKRFRFNSIIVPHLVCFVTILLTVFITDPVPSEGWVRTIYISALISTQFPVAFLFVTGLTGKKADSLILSKIYAVFLFTVPLGLLLHHPWNYFLFFSPLYWISWAWITPESYESLLYGVISIIITIGCIVLFVRQFLTKYSV